MGGEVGIDSSPIPNDPQATIRKAQQIQAAAQAPANPSATDRQVAANAAHMESEARQEISRQGLEDKDQNSHASDRPEVEKVGAEDTEPPNAYTDTVARSAYEVIADLSQPQKDAGPLIDLVA